MSQHDNINAAVRRALDGIRARSCVVVQRPGESNEALAARKPEVLECVDGELKIRDGLPLVILKAGLSG